MDSIDAIQLIIILVFLLLSAFFSLTELALISVNKAKVLSLAEEKNKNAFFLTKILDDIHQTWCTIIICNNIVSLSAASLSTMLAIRLWGNASIGVVIGGLIFFLSIFGTIAPKILASHYAEKIILMCAPLLFGIRIVLSPVVSLLGGLSAVFLKPFRVSPKIKLNGMTDNELHNIVNASTENGTFETEEQKIIKNVFDFKDSQARDIMVPRINMTFANINSTYDDLLNLYRVEKFTRIPIYEDTSDNVIGIINIKDLLLYDKNQIFDVRNYLREPYYTYEYKKTSELLIEMRKSSINIAIVLDEYGATAGLITLEDLLEEIVGEIRDEYDSEEEDFVKKVNTFEYIIEGSMDLDDINEMLGLALHSEDYDSIAGLMIELLDHLPEQGEEVITTSKIRLVAEKVDKKRIKKVHLYLPEVSEDKEIADSALEALE